MNAAFRRFAAEVGRDPMHIQGPSGNISMKCGDSMLVKASGTRLSEAEHSDIFVEVRLPSGESENRFVELRSRDSTSEIMQLRPSIETALHVVMPHRFVLHTHSVHALAHVVRAEAEASISSLLLSRAGVALVDYARPGEALADRIVEALRTRPDLDVVLLKNHGLVVGSETVDGLKSLLEEVDNALKIACLAQDGRLQELGCDEGSAPVGPSVVQRMAFSPSFEMLADSWPLFPDQAIFLGPTIEVYGDVIRTEHFTVKRGRGVCSARDVPSSVLEQLVCVAEVIVRQNGMQVLRGIGAREANELVNWGSEVHRKQREASRDAPDLL